MTYPVFEALSFRMARHPGGIRKQSGQNADRSRLSDGPRFARNGFIERGLTSRNDAEEYRDLKHRAVHALNGRDSKRHGPSGCAFLGCSSMIGNTYIELNSRPELTTVQVACNWK